MERPVRDANPADHLDVMRLLDGALLEIDGDTIAARIDAGSVFVVDGRARPAGVLVLDDTTIEAIAVRRARRDQGIGRRLAVAALDRRGRLTAEFDDRVRAFYEAIGFDVTAAEGSADRYYGVLE